MAEYTCKSEKCGRTFDEEEKRLTNDENKCILHCDKIEWHQLKDTILGEQKICDELKYKIFYDTFIKRFSREKQDSLYIKGIHFPNNLLMDGGSALSRVTMNENINKINISKCKFYGDQNIELNTLPSYELESMSIFDIHSDYKISFNDAKIKNLKISTSNINNLHMQFSEFKNLTISGHFSEVQYRTIKDINIIKTTVKNDCLIYELKLTTLRLHSVEFVKTTFEKLFIKNELELDKSKFDKRLDFFEVEYLNKLNLEKTLIPKDTSFLRLTSDIYTKKAIKVQNRETARKIKDSFEIQNNIIEANKYYALEMKEREKELELTKKNNWFEWLVFKIHGISSNHSQDWLLALFWIVIVGVFASYFSFYTMQDKMGNYVHFNILPFLGTMILSFAILGSKYIFKTLEKMYYYLVFVFFPLLYYYTTNDSWFTLFSNTINPFSIMTKGDTLNLGILIFKVIIAYLIYQFVVSVRQNTRRK